MLSCLCALMIVYYLSSLSRSSYTYTYTDTSKHVCHGLFASLSIPDSWLSNSDSLSLLIQSYIPTCILVCLCMYIYICMFSVSIPHSWLSNSLFLLDTGSFFCPTTSCRPCHRTFLPSFHRFSECVFLVAEY